MNNTRRIMLLIDADNVSADVMEQALELARLDIVTPEVRSAVEGYNADDCLSTLRLRDWLETQRTGLIGDGIDIPRPALKEAAASQALNERQQRVADLRAQITALAGADIVDGIMRTSRSSNTAA